MKTTRWAVVVGMVTGVLYNCNLDLEAQTLTNAVVSAQPDVSQVQKNETLATDIQRYLSAVDDGWGPKWEQLVRNVQTNPGSPEIVVGILRDSLSRLLAGKEKFQDGYIAGRASSLLVQMGSFGTVTKDDILQLREVIEKGKCESRFALVGLLGAIDNQASIDAIVSLGVRWTSQRSPDLNGLLEICTAVEKTAGQKEHVDKSKLIEVLQNVNGLETTVPTEKPLLKHLKERVAKIVPSTGQTK